MRRYTLFLFLIPMVLLFSSCGLTKKTPAARYEEAQMLISEGRYREAVKILADVLAGGAHRHVRLQTALREGGTVRRIG